MDGADGFEVDLAALRQAAEGIRRTTERAGGPTDVVPGAAVLGHEGLTGATAEFLARWRRGVADLVADGRAAGDALQAAAEVYERVDAAGARSVDGTLRAGTGPDPAGPR